MEDTPEALAVLPQNIQGIAMGFPVVNVDGQIQFYSQLDLFDKDLLLQLPGRFRPVVIEAHFANGYDLGFCFGQVPQGSQITGLYLCRFLRMDSHSSIHLPVLPAEGDGLAGRAQVRTGAEQILHAPVKGPLQHGLAVRCKGLVVDVTMRVKEH